MQEPRRWTNHSQPQTLQIAVFLLYAEAGFYLFYLLVGLASPQFTAPIIAGRVAAGFGIANEKKWGYWVGVAMALLPLALIFSGLARFNVISLMFDVALVALLVHPESRDHQRLWFK